MRKSYQFFLIFVLAAVVQLACNLPLSTSPASPTVAPTSTFPFPLATPTNTLPPVVTATTAAQPTATQQPAAQPTATSQPTATQNSSSATKTSSCTYIATFVSDVTIPDDSIIPAGQSFVKTWRVRNDGTCTWGPNRTLHALVFTGGSRMSTPEQVELPGEVGPGKSVDLSLTFTAPTSDGVYTSEWKFRIDNDANAGPYLGLGPAKVGPLYVRIKVGSSTSTSPKRIEFASGATSAGVTGDLKANETKSFMLYAMRDQVLIASISSTNNEVKVKIMSKDGTTLANASNTSSTAYLPSDQDYIVSVTAGGSATSFSLGVTIPSRITFDKDAVSDEVSGKVVDHNAVAYILWAKNGQTMTINLEGSGVALTIYGLKDGQPLLRADKGVTSWSNILSASQDYIIMVVPSVDKTEFKLKVTVK